MGNGTGLSISPIGFSKFRPNASSRVLLVDNLL